MENYLAAGAVLLFVVGVVLAIRYKFKAEKVTVQGLAAIMRDSAEAMDAINKAHARSILESQAALATNTQIAAAARAGVASPPA